MKAGAWFASLPRDKADTLLLLAATVLVLAPHTAHLPLWVTLVCIATLAWRATITLRGKRMPSSLVLLPVAVGAMFGVQASYDTLIGRDAGVAMLVLLVAFKMLEMHARRDLYVVVFLCFFLVLTNFFYSQGIGTAVLMLASVLLLLATQLSFQFTGSVPPLRQRLAMAARMLAMAAPLAVLLFVVFPRIGGPLWGGTGGDRAGRSGLSEHMAPGQMSNLALSDEPAFRVRFDGAAPAQEHLYWRGPVLEAFDGLTWTRGEGNRAASGELRLSVGGPAIDYEVTLEPSQSRWVFALEMPGRIPRLPGRPVQATSQFELVAGGPLTERLRYRARSHLAYALQGGHQLEGANRWLLLPYGYNPRALQEGLALRRLADPASRVEAVLRMFRTQPFSYTLEPPLLGRHSIDEFLYGSRAGFCEHYSGAFVFLMRAAGVPARVVTGYQGGAINPLDGYMTVRQSDAHAWAEVWLAGRGWLRVDPTAAVAPERVRRGLSAAVERPAPFGIEALRGFGFDPAADSVLGRLRQALAAVNNGWNQWVLDYTPRRQRSVLESIKASLFGWRFAAVITSACLLLLLVGILRRRREIHPADALYLTLCRRLGQLGLVRATDEGPTAYAARLATASQLAPASRRAAAEFLRRYSDWRYAPAQADPRLVAMLKSLLSQVR